MSARFKAKLWASEEVTAFTTEDTFRTERTLICHPERSEGPAV